MALHYIVDGYNVIKKTAFLNHKKLKDSRDALLDFIDKHRPHGSHNNQITVIFDGRDDVFSFKHKYDFCVFFTRKESADERIKAMVDKAVNAKTIVVVSEDKDIKLYCRSRGARIFSVGEFLQKAHKKQSVSKAQDPDVLELSMGEQKKINEELSKVWLK
jgi:predicted RNA-binding protein with PIN domain